MRIGVLGCGSIGRRHLANLRDLGNRDLVAYDPSETARNEVAEAGFSCVAELRRFWLGEPEVVIVATPPHLHVKQCLEAVDRGCHIFVEKPLSDSIEGNRQLLGRLQAKGLTSMVGCNMRFHPGPATVRRLLAEESIGPVVAARIETGSYLPGWRPQSNYKNSYSAHAEFGGGAVLDCIHEIDLALWYFGPGYLHASRVRRARGLDLEVDGLAELLIEHSNGVLSSLHLNFVQRDYRRNCQVIGESGTIYWDFHQPRVEIRRGERAVERIELDPSWQINQMYLDEMAYFLDRVEQGKPTFCGIEQGMQSLQIALECRSEGGNRRSSRGRIEV